MSKRMPRRGEIWEYMPSGELWLVIENGKKPQHRFIVRVDGQHYCEYHFNQHLYMWEKRA